MSLGLLPFRPEPFDDESPLGWIQRFAHVNGYSSTHSFLKSHGASISEINKTGVDLLILMECSGKSREQLSKISYKASQSHKDLLSFLGQPIRSRHINASEQQICLDCLKENGYVKSIWNIGFYRYCHIHSKPLTSTAVCLSCSRKNIKTRTEVGRCSHCFEEFPKQQSSVVDAALLELTHLIYNSALKIEQPDYTSPILNEIKNWSLKNLLQLIQYIGTLRIYGHPSYKTQSHRDLEKTLLSANHVLANWPVNFHEFIYKLLTRSKKPIQTSSRFVGMLNDFINSCIEHVDDKKYEGLLCKEMQKFLCKSWPLEIQEKVDSQLYEMDFFSNFLTFPALSKKFNVPIESIKSYIEHQKIPTKTIHRNKSSIEIVDSSLINPELFKSTKLFNFGAAAAFLGVPQMALKKYKAQNLMEITYFGPKNDHFDLRDLEAFRNKLANLANYLDSSSKNLYQDYRYLGCIREFSLGSKKGLVLMKKILAKKIPIFKTSNFHDVSNLLISRKDIDKFNPSKL